MNIKQFEGSSMAEALAKVKGELGTKAVILHARSYRKGGLMGWWARNVVEITASADVNIHERRRKAAAKSGRADDSGSYPAQGGGSGGGGGQEAQPRNLFKNVYGQQGKAGGEQGAGGALGGEIRTTSHKRGGGGGGGHAGVEYASTREMAVATLKDPGFELRSELADLKTMVESLLHRTSTTVTTRGDLPAELSKAYVMLIQQQVAEEIAWRVVEDVKTELSPEQLASSSMVRERLTSKLAAMISTESVGHLSRPVGSQKGENGGVGGEQGIKCRSICLIGPTGVGKTTTIAKLAAGMKLRQKQRVGLITIDTYRIAAVDQLRTYANIIGVPLKVVLTPGELSEALHEMRHLDTVLIDTAGRSPSDDLKLNELAGFMQAANPSEVHLVLSSTCTQQAMEAAVAKFSAVRVDRIIFTKLDEAVSFGVLLNVARKASKTLSYITTGQDVPDHVEVGQPRRLAKLILGEKL